MSNDVQSSISDDKRGLLSGQPGQSARYLAGVADFHGPRLTTLVLEIGIEVTLIGFHPSLVRLLVIWRNGGFRVLHPPTGSVMRLGLIWSHYGENEHRPPCSIARQRNSNSTA